MANEFAHYGIPGMHWYIRRYQPYPRGYRGQGRPIGKAQAATATRNANSHSAKPAKSSESSKKAKLTPEEKLAKKKQELLDNASPTEIYKNRKLFTYDELNTIWRRFELESKIRGEAETRSGKKLTATNKNKKDYIGAGRKFLQGYTNVVTDITKAYDATQKGKKLINNLFGTNMAIKDPINQSKKKKSQNKSDGDSE